MRRVAIASVVGLSLVAAGVGIGFWLAQRPSMDMAGQTTADGGRVLYWYDPMVPDQHFDQPGKSPFMDMQLVPRYAGEPEAAPGVRIDPGVAQNLGVRFAVAVKEPVKASITASGVIAFNERDVAIVQAKQGGFVERSHRRAIGDIVRAGDALVDLRVPEWTGALAEYLALSKGADAALAAAARKRLAMLGVPADATREAEASAVAPSVFIIRAPITGALTSLDVREGMTVEPGAAIASINGLSPVWLMVSAPQGAAGPLKPGGRASARFPAYPGEAFTGKIEAILPAANAASRAIEVRVALANPDGRLRPGMTGEADLSDAAPREALVVPSEAVIRTGRRTVVIAVLEDGRFAPTEVDTGPTSGDRTEIISGLSEGQKVVASGQFLIDSEASLTGVMARLQASPPAAQDAPYATTGRVTAIDDKGITLSHAPVARLNWPAMTMQFAWGPGGMKNIAVGDEVTFTFRKAGGGYVIETIERVGGGR
ncbi:MAG: efflux RND transporter periplasmic adaptor subunit [Hyphomonadaceae bacterium]|nr:efflux RND transporter periplasmic adaptor subunit [Hyphomonadaceae bacterium]